MPRSILQGVVVNISGDKTVKVKVTRDVAHSRYGKRVKVSKNYLAHCESGDYKAGDIVKIIECKPISKQKKFEIFVDKKASK